MCKKIVCWPQYEKKCGWELTFAQGECKSNQTRWNKTNSITIFTSKKKIVFLQERQSMERTERNNRGTINIFLSRDHKFWRKIKWNMQSLLTKSPEHMDKHKNRKASEKEDKWRAEEKKACHDVNSECVLKVASQTKESQNLNWVCIAQSYRKYIYIYTERIPIEVQHSIPDQYTSYDHKEKWYFCLADEKRTT